MFFVGFKLRTLWLSATNWPFSSVFMGSQS